jgi:hypothetical protein
MAKKGIDVRESREYIHPKSNKPTKNKKHTRYIDVPTASEKQIEEIRHGNPHPKESKPYDRNEAMEDLVEDVFYDDYDEAWLALWKSESFDDLKESFDYIARMNDFPMELREKKFKNREDIAEALEDGFGENNKYLYNEYVRQMSNPDAQKTEEFIRRMYYKGERKPIIIKTSYMRTTEESAMEGDWSDTGWIDEEGEEFENVEDAIDWLESEGAIHPSSSAFSEGIWYDSDPEMIDYETGEDERRSFHIKGASIGEQKEIFKKIR